MEEKRILGIDPGLRNTGWGIVAKKGTNLSFVACGVIRPKTDLALADRLAEIYTGLQSVLAEFLPHEAAVEETFVNKDPKSTLKLGQARGIALVTPAMNGLSVGEYAANKIKKSVVGAGHADKGQIHAMVKILLPKARINSPDEADALAIAICHAHHGNAHFETKIAGALS